MKTINILIKLCFFFLILSFALCGVVSNGFSAEVGYGKMPVTDSAFKAAVEKEVKHPIPKGLNISNLYHEGNLVITPRLDVEKLMEEDAAQGKLGPLRMGMVQEFGPKTGRDGQWTELQDGGHLWTIAFQASGAFGIRLRIRPWSPPSGAELIIYDAHNPDYSIGPFTSSLKKKANELWTPIIFSDEVRVEYYLPPGLDHLGPKSQITIDGLLNQYRHLPGALPSEGTTPVELSCHLDVTCYPDWANEAESVAALTYVSNPPAGGFFCTGSLLNRVPTDYTPFFQTARHCGIDTQSEADSVLVFWQYQTSTCNGTPPNPATLPRTSGAVLLVDDPTADYTLIGLESDVGSYNYLGWDPNYWANESAATGIHHPGGTYKRITFGTKKGDIDSCISGTTPAWLIYSDGTGEIEPGSSGSPIFDSAHRVRGVASCASWSCSSDDWYAYGQFYEAWPKVEPYLYRNDPSEWDAYTNGLYNGSEWGTLTQPFKTVLKSVFAVRRGYNVYIESGNYHEQFTIDKPMTLNSRNGVVTIGQ